MVLWCSFFPSFFKPENIIHFCSTSTSCFVTNIQPVHLYVTFVYVYCIFIYSCQKKCACVATVFFDYMVFYDQRRPSVTKYVTGNILFVSLWFFFFAISVTLNKRLLRIVILCSICKTLRYFLYPSLNVFHFHQKDQHTLTIDTLFRLPCQPPTLICTNLMLYFRSTQYASISLKNLTTQRIFELQTNKFLAVFRNAIIQSVT